MSDVHHLSVRRTARYCTCGPEEAEEVWVTLHGYGQRAGELLETLSLLCDGTRRLVAPEALSRYYRHGVRGEVGASWMTSADRKCEIEDYLHYLDTLYKVLDLKGVKRLCVFGFSQGAATAARWAARAPTVPDALILWAGGIPLDVDLNKLRDCRLVLVVGENDKYMSSELLRQEQQRLDEAELSYRCVRFEGGHHVAAEPLRDVMNVYAKK